MQFCTPLASDCNDGEMVASLGAECRSRSGGDQLIDHPRMAADDGLGRSARRMLFFQLLPPRIENTAQRARVARDC